MSDQPAPDLPIHKMVDGVLVELTQDEIDEILAERERVQTPQETPQ